MKTVYRPAWVLQRRVGRHGAKAAGSPCLVAGVRLARASSTAAAARRAPCARRARGPRARATPYTAGCRRRAYQGTGAHLEVRIGALDALHERLVRLARERRYFDRLPQISGEGRRGRGRTWDEYASKSVCAPSHARRMRKSRPDARRYSDRSHTAPLVRRNSATNGLQRVSRRSHSRSEAHRRKDSESSSRMTGPRRRTYANQNSAGKSTAPTATCTAASCSRAWIARPTVLCVCAGVSIHKGAKLDVR